MYVDLKPCAASGPALRRSTSVEDSISQNGCLPEGSGEETDASYNQSGPNDIKLFEGIDSQWQFITVIHWNCENSYDGYNQVDDCKKPKWCAPAEKLCCDTRENGTKDKTQWISCTEAGKGKVLSSGWLLIDAT